MNRRDLQVLARMRLSEAKVLMSNGHYAGAYYLAGYSIECALKACIAKQTKQGAFPDKTLANKVHVHELESLLKLAGLEPALKEHLTEDKALELNWQIAKDWKVDSRYAITTTESVARDMLSACSAAKRGVLAWESTMVATVSQVLTPEMIKAGEALIKKLDSSNLRIQAALWLLDSEIQQWRLILASPAVQSKGPKEFYRRVRAALLQAKVAVAPLELSSIVAVSDQYPLIVLLSKALRTSLGSGGVRFSRNTIDGQYIEDAYIYRLHT